MEAKGLAPVVESKKDELGHALFVEETPHASGTAALLSESNPVKAEDETAIEDDSTVFEAKCIVAESTKDEVGQAGCITFVELSDSGSELDEDLDLGGMIRALYAKQNKAERAWERLNSDAFSLLVSTRRQLSEMGDRLGYMHELIAEFQESIHGKVGTVWQRLFAEHERMLDQITGSDGEENC